MKVTSVEPQKRKDRYNIFVDGKFWCGLSENSLAKYSLYPGKDVDSKILDEIFKYEIFNKVYNGSISKIGRRPHSEWEIEKYVNERFWKNKEKWFKDTEYLDKYEELRDETRKTIIKKLVNQKYLDDKEFVKWWISSRKSSRPRGWVAIKSELLSKGVERSLLNEFEFSEGEEENLAQKYIEKITRSRKISREKLISRLSSRGFKWDTIKSVLKDDELEGTS